MTQFTLPKPSYHSKASVEVFAEGLAQELNFGIGDALEPLVEELGGAIVYGHMDADEEDGGSIIVRDYDDFSVVLSDFTSPLRDRFTIAHELGHLFLHFPVTIAANPGCVMRATRWVDNKDPEQQRAEWEANWFAAAFLMPAEPFLASVKEHGTSYAAAKFNVSPTAANVRLAALQ
jgi:Zn-dependent peptidase ImmA (M78 family)